MAVTCQAPTTFLEIGRVNFVHYRSFGEACKARDLLADDVELVQVLGDASRSSLGPVPHVFATILATCETSSPRDLWKYHRKMFNIYFRNRFRGPQDCLANDFDGLAYMLLKVRDYFTKMVTAPFSTFGRPNVCKDLSLLPAEKQQFELNLESLRSETNASISSLKRGH